MFQEVLLRMDFDFDEMSRLYREAPEVFEQSRIELINDTIERCSGPQREALKKLQYELDQIRNKQPEYFLAHCFQEMSENVSELSNQWRKIATHVASLN
jgi:hypothetical protein